MTVQSDLLSEIEAFLAKRGSMAETTFGKLAVNDGKFVRRLRDGCNMTLATIDRVRLFISSQQHAPETAAPVAKPKPKRPAATRAAATPSAPQHKAA
jgi:hypothetical protein